MYVDVRGATHNLLKLWRHGVCRGRQKGGAHLFPITFLYDPTIECKQQAQEGLRRLSFNSTR